MAYVLANGVGALKPREPIRVAVPRVPPTILPSAALTTALQEHGADDYQSLHGPVEVLADGRGEVEHVADEREHDRAHHGPPHVAGTALESCAADDNGGDGLELPEETRRARRRAEARAVQPDRAGHAHARAHVR